MITFYVIDKNKVWTGQAVEKPVFATWADREIPEKPPLLQEGQFAQWTGLTWEVHAEYPTPIVDLEDIKIAKKAEIKQLRDAKIAEPINNIDVRNADDKENIQGAIQNFDTMYPSGQVLWTMADNTDQIITKGLLISVVSQYATRKAAVFARYQELKAHIDSATTQNELEGIKW